MATLRPNDLHATLALLGRATTAELASLYSVPVSVLYRALHAAETAGLVQPLTHPRHPAAVVWGAS